MGIEQQQSPAFLYTFFTEGIHFGFRVPLSALLATAGSEYVFSKLTSNAAWIEGGFLLYNLKIIGRQTPDRWTERCPMFLLLWLCAQEPVFNPKQPFMDSSIPRHFTLLTAIQCWVVQKGTAVTIPWSSFKVFISWMWSWSLLGTALMVYRKWFSFKVYSFKRTNKPCMIING